MSDDYRARVRALRAEAHQRLRQLRAERRGAARRRLPVVAGSGPATLAAPVANRAPTAIDVSEDVAALARELAAVAPDASTAPRPTACDAPAAPGAFGAVDDGGAPPALATVEAPADGAAAVEAAEAVSLRTGVDRVPGVGPGLVWMLGEAGVRTLDDLLSSDAAALSERLGLVGRLIDVARLQRLAADLRRADVSA
jgi:hypothetical protein